MWVEQAVYTSIPRRSMSGYHVVARSPGVPEADAVALATWSPSSGALIVDNANRTSVNFHPLPSGRCALSRTCEGPAEYSGRGGRQLYTHALIIEPDALRKLGVPPIALCRDALALGYLRYQHEPAPLLQPVQLCTFFPEADSTTWSARARALGLPAPESVRAQLAQGQNVQLRFAGDRIALAECLLGTIPLDYLPEASFSTSLQPSAVRPYRLSLLN